MDIPTKNYTVIRGDEFSGVTYTIANSGIAVDLSTADIKMQIRKSCGGDLILEFSTDDASIVIDDAANGHFYIAPIVIDETPGVYVYEMEINGTELGNPRTVLKGQFVIQQDITR